MAHCFTIHMNTGAIGDQDRNTESTSSKFRQRECSSEARLARAARLDHRAPRRYRQPASQPGSRFSGDHEDHYTTLFADGINGPVRSSERIPPLGPSKKTTATTTEARRKEGNKDRSNTPGHIFIYLFSFAHHAKHNRTSSQKDSKGQPTRFPSGRVVRCVLEKLSEKRKAKRVGHRSSVPVLPFSFSVH